MRDLSSPSLASAPIFHVLLIFLLALLVYYPVFPGQIISIDDIGMMQGLFHTDSYDLRQIFLPRSQQGQYFRPLIGVSFFFDRFVLNANPWLMHLENILFQAVNGMLVYVAVGAALVGSSALLQSATKNGIALLAALFFVVHPLATESICWLSGRTDLLAGSFILISLLAILEYRQSGRKLLLIAAFLFILFALLVKESAIGFLFGILFILVADAREDSPLLHGRRDRNIALAVLSACLLLQLFTFNTTAPLSLLFGYCCYLTFSTGLFARKKRETGLLVLLFSAAVGLFVVVRRIAFTTSVSRISDTLKLIFGDISYSFHLFLTGFGFYTKKFFLPMPLNFAIREIDPLYSLVGLVVVFLIIRWFFVNSLASGLILAGYSLVIPALALTFGTIAWTAYAERYVYMTTAFWIIACVLMLVKLLQTQTRAMQRGIVGFFIVLLVFFAASSHLRARVWQTNETLFADTVAKSPRFRMGYEHHMAALVDNKKYDQARRVYEKGVVLPTIQYEPLLDVLLAQVCIAEGKQQEALNLYDKIALLHKDKTGSAYRLMNDYLATVVRKSEGRKRDDFIVRMILNQERIVAIDHDAFDSYILGKMYLSSGRASDAVVAFGVASASAPPGSCYLPAAQRLRQILSQ